MTTLPIAVCMFTTTKPHFGHYTYLDTLNHLNRQIPLGQFGSLYCHLKVTPGHEVTAAAMCRELEGRGFVVEQTVGNWVRGTSHQVAYLEDIRKASQSTVIQSQPHVLFLEDDSTLSPNRDNLLFYLARMVGFLQADHNLVSTRLIRRCDFNGGVPMLNSQYDHFFSPNLDFQPGIYRSRDFLLANKVIQDNWSQLSHLQCELVMRIAFDSLSRSENRHLVLHPDYIESHHLGTPDYLKMRAALSL